MVGEREVDFPPFGGLPGDRHLNLGRQPLHNGPAGR